MTFIDRLVATIEKNGSILVAGFDPNLDTFPTFVLEEAARRSASNEDFAFVALRDYFTTALEACGCYVAAVKPNTAFFEQYGIGGLRALAYICEAIRNLGIPVIVDAKRGDIGTTAKAYSNAFLSKAIVSHRTYRLVEGDALTVNPYLGFDTLEPFLQDCKSSGKGIFVLVKTSNPGSADIQNARDESGTTISAKVCEWIQSRAGELHGESGLSGLGAVVGATYPEEAKVIRNLIPNSLFLVPGFGAQGATALDALQGAVTSSKEYRLGINPGGVIVNASRGLFQGHAHDTESLKELVKTNVRRLSLELVEGAKAVVA